MEWPTEKIFRLIDLFHAKHCLWDPRDKNYKKNTIKSKAWKDLGEEIEVNTIDAKKKMDSLLASFRRERQKAQLARSCGADTVYVSKWFAFNALKFLNQKYNTKETESPTHNIRKRECSSVDSLIEETTCNDSVQDDEDDDGDPLTSNDISYECMKPEGSVTSSFRSANKKQKLDETAIGQQQQQLQFNEMLSQFSKYAANRSLPTTAPSKHQPFLQLVEQKLDALPEDHQEDVKLGIITYIFDYVKDFKNKVNSNENFS